MIPALTKDAAADEAPEPELPIDEDDVRGRRRRPRRGRRRGDRGRAGGRRRDEAGSRGDPAGAGPEEAGRARPVIPPAPAAQQRPAPSPRPRPRASAAAPAAALPPLPTVRRGGYDKDAVDARLRQLAADHAEFGQRATRAEARISELETALAEARREPRSRRTPVSAAARARCSGWPRRRPPRCAWSPSATPTRSASRPPATPGDQGRRQPATPRTCGSCTPRSSTTTGRG